MHQASHTTDRQGIGSRHRTDGQATSSLPNNLPQNGTLRIAIADGDPGARNHLQTILKALGHDVIATVENGLKLVEICDALAPELAIVAVNLPGLDGIEATAALNRTRPVPTILLMDNHDGEVLTRFDSEPVMGFLVKPVKEAEMKTALWMAMLRFRQLSSLKKEAADLRQALEDRKVIERAKGVLMRRIKVDEDEAFRRIRMLASAENLKLVELSKRILAAEEIFARFDRI